METRTYLMNRQRRSGAEASVLVWGGTAEAVPFPKRELIRLAGDQLAHQKINERTVEVLGRFFVGQVANALQCNQTHIAKIPA